MKADRLATLAENPDFIPGIYNYCDRWCQRCAFTGRCLSFASERDEFPGGETPDIDSEEFWESFTETMNSSLELLRQMAAEDGIDLDAIDYDQIDAERQAVQTAVDEHPLTQAAERYAGMVKDWFENNAAAFQQKGEELEMFVRLNIGSADVTGQAARISDAVEVIQWYQLFIPGKIVRALHGRSYSFADESDAAPNDADGSAKICLIAIERSLAAWVVLLRAFPYLQTENLELLAQLERLGKGLELEFPNARAFQRPGFDALPPEELALELE